MPFMRNYRQKLQPAWKKEADDIVEWTLLRPFSIYLSVPFGKLGLRAVHASLLCFAAALSGSLLISSGELHLIAAGAALVCFSFLLDCVDGELARFHNSGSWRGTYLDFLVGGVNDLLIMAGMSCGVAILLGLDMRLFIFLGVLTAGGEKLVDLYAQSVFYRYAEKLVPDRDWQKSVLPEQQEETRVLRLGEKLIRAPFTTFGRVNIFFVASVISWISGKSEFAVFGYALIVLLIVVYIGRILFNTYVRNQIERRLAEKSAGLAQK